MGRRDDVNKLYYWPKKIDKLMEVFFWGNVSTAFLGCFLINDQMLKIVLLIQIFLSIGYVIASVIDDNFLWYRAEKIRRESSIENAFGLELLEEKTEEYYNNQFPKGINKYATNAFESILHSKTTLTLMFPTEVFKIIGAGIIFLITCLLYKEYSIVLIISQTVFSSYFLQQFVKFVVFKSHLEKLYELLYKELVTVGIKDEAQKVLLLNYVIEYESVKAHYKVKLCEKKFFKHNRETSARWREICDKIKIQ